MLFCSESLAPSSAMLRATPGRRAGPGNPYNATPKRSPPSRAPPAISPLQDLPHFMAAAAAGPEAYAYPYGLLPSPRPSPLTSPRPGAPHRRKSSARRLFGMAQPAGAAAGQAEAGLPHSLSHSSTQGHCSPFAAVTGGPPFCMPLALPTTTLPGPQQATVLSPGAAPGHSATPRRALPPPLSLPSADGLTHSHAAAFSTPTTAAAAAASLLCHSPPLPQPTPGSASEGESSQPHRRQRLTSPRRQARKQARALPPPQQPLPHPDHLPPAPQEQAGLPTAPAAPAAGMQDAPEGVQGLLFDEQGVTPGVQAAISAAVQEAVEVQLGSLQNMVDAAVQSAMNNAVDRYISTLPEDCLPGTPRR
jgi:hypothetical protein